jgi:Na+/melibiose symporter-like transporter
MGITNLMGLIVGPLGGFLAGRAFGLTAGLGAGLLFTLAFLTFRLLKEPKSTSVDQESFRSAVKQLQKLLHSRSLWTAAGMTFLFYIAPGFGTPLFFYQSETLKLKPQFIGNLAVISGITGLLAAGLYGALCRKLPLRVLLASGVAINAVGTLAYLAYRSPGSAIAIEGLNGVIATLALLPLFDLAARATPKGSESMGYALLMSVGNLASAFSEVSGSWLYEHLHLTFLNLVWVNAGTTAIGLLAIPFLPAFLMRQRDGD